MSATTRESQAAFLLTAAILALVPAGASALGPGDLLISEVMANPSQVTDADGEWFELFNATSAAIDLRGLVISDDSSGSHHTISGATPVEVGPGAYITLGRNGNPAANGGYNAGYVYTGFVLANSADEIRIFDGVLEVVGLAYTVGFSTAGASAELVIQTTSPGEGDYATTPLSLVYGDGDVGTPGTAGTVPLVANGAAPVPLGSALAPGISLVMLLSGFVKLSSRARTN